MKKYLCDGAGLFRIDFKTDEIERFKLTLITVNDDGTVTAHENNHYYNSRLFYKDTTNIFECEDDESAMLYYEAMKNE